MQITKEFLIEQHINSNKSIGEISRILSCSSTKVRNAMRRHGITTIQREYNLIDLDINQITELYFQGNSITAIASQLKVSEPTITNRLKLAGITIKPSTTYLKIIDIPDLQKLYVDQKKSAEEIGKLYSVSGDTILKKLRQQNIAIRTRKEQLEIDIPDLQKLYVDQKKSTKEIADMYGIVPSIVSKKMRLQNIMLRDDAFSTYEIEINKFLNSLGINKHIMNDRKLLSGKEIDILVHSHKLAIEFNGMRWHTDKFKSKSSHIFKSIECKKLGYHLIHVWEWIWIEKNDIYKSIIKSSLGIYNQKLYARKCIIKSLSYSIASKFFDVNHIQGKQSATVYFGLFHNDELVQMMSFLKTSNHWEISRLCSKLNLIIIGGTQKLWNHFIKTCDPDKVITYSDASIFTGNIYEKLGMIRGKMTVKDYYWIRGKVALNRHKCQKHKLLKAGYIGESEVAIMEARGFNKLYKCGNNKFIWTRTH